MVDTAKLSAHSKSKDTISVIGCPAIHFYKTSCKVIVTHFNKLSTSRNFPSWALDNKSLSEYIEMSLANCLIQIDIVHCAI